MSIKRSPLWKYYDVCTVDSKYAVCLLCNSRISRGGDGKKAGTSSMKNHLKNKHFDKFAETYGGTSVPSKGTNISSTSVNIPSTSITFVQPVIQTSSKLKDTERKRQADPKSQELHYLIGEMIALDNEPLSLVDRVGFTRLMKQAVPRFELPSAKYMAEEIIPDIYRRLHAKITENIFRATAVSVTSDRWSCDHNNKSFLSFTAHWLSAGFVLEHAVLAIVPFAGSHTRDGIANELNEIASRWNMPLNKTHIVIHNSEFNIEKDARTSDYDYACCFIRSLQKVVEKSWKAQSDLMEMLAAARQIVTHFNQSALAQEILRAIQKELKLPEHQLVQDASGRWNSTYYLQKRLLEQKSAISLCISSHNKVHNLTPFQWNLMEQCIGLFQPFEEITRVISSGCSCISEVIPHVAALRRYLQKGETARKAPNLLHIITSLKSRIEDLFWDLEENQNYLIATFLDPRFKANFFENKAQRVREIMLIEAVKMNLKKEDSANSVGPVGDSPPTKRRAVASGGHTLWDCFDEVAQDNKQNEDSGKTAIAIELDFYLKMVRIDRTDDPYTWWSANARQYPIMIKLAMVYLSSPCSTVYNQVLFSEAGLLYEYERNCLLPPNDEKLLFIHHNLPLVGFKY